MLLYSKNPAKIKHKNSGKVIDINFTDLHWESIFEEEDRKLGMGSKVRHVGAIDIKENDFGELVWEVWEYPEGTVCDNSIQSVNEHSVVQNFTFEFKDNAVSDKGKNLAEEMSKYLDIVKYPESSESIRIQGVFFLGLVVSVENEVNEKSMNSREQVIGRDPDQAYILIPTEICNSNFFPEIGEHFQVLTDDDKRITLVRAQESGKALHTPEDNAQLGKYLRHRMKIESGKFLTYQDLLEYGRTYVTIAKTLNGSFYMDFGMPPMIISTGVNPSGIDRSDKIPFPTLTKWKSPS